jgi:hypothetical protein
MRDNAGVEAVAASLEQFVYLWKPSLQVPQGGFDRIKI